MKYTKLLATLFFTGLLLSGCGSNSKENPAAVTQPAATQTAATPAAATPPAATPNVLASTTIVTTAGQSIQVDKTAGGFIFHGYEGKIVLLEVYGDTCPHCVAAIPSYNALQAKYSNDVVVIALESYGTLTNAGQQQYITVPKANTGNMFSFIKELTGYGLQAVPYLMILYRSGDYTYQQVLADFPQAEIDSRIQQLL
jgi:thiol-disulfide isomerase/thioredoxin